MKLMFKRGPRSVMMLAVALVLFSAPGAVHAQDEDLLVVRATGHAEGTGVGARRTAVNDAVHKAMRDVLVKKAHTEDLTYLRPILLYASRYVERPEVIRMDETERGTTVEADIYLHDRAIDRDIAAAMLPRLHKKPSLTLLIGEKPGPEEDLAVPDFGMAETTLRDGLTGLQLEVRGADSLDGLYGHRRLVEIVTGGARLGSEFARAQETDVTVVGEAAIELEDTVGSGEVKRTVARLKLRVFRSLDGDMIYDLSSEAALYGEDLREAAEQALEDAALKLVGDTAMASVLAMLGQQEMGDAYVTLVLEQPRTEARVTSLVTALRGDPEILSAETRLYSEDLARVLLRYSGSMGVISQLLDGCEVEGRLLKVRTVIGREITARFE